MKGVCQVVNNITGTILNYFNRSIYKIIHRDNINIPFVGPVYFDSYPRQNGLAIALRELGKIERTIFMLNWFMDPALRRRVTAGLNKGEARNALARAVCFNRLGEMRDSSYEQQRHRASGLNLVTAAIVHWNTVYLDKAINAMKEHGQQVDDNLLQYLSPLAWEHINLTGDYVWAQNKQPKKGKYRPLRPFSMP